MCHVNLTLLLGVCALCRWLEGNWPTLVNVRRPRIKDRDKWGLWWRVDVRQMLGVS